MATTKATGVTKLGRDSLPKYLGIKLFAGQIAKVGQILVRQRGTKFMAGKNVKRGGDDSLYALKEGIVRFSKKRKKCFNRLQRIVNIVNVETP